MEKREYLSDGNDIILYGESNGRIFERTFHIVGEAEGEGASCVCYVAYHDGSGKGVLREFYPLDINYAGRNEARQLMISEESEAGFKEKEKCYIEPYERLKRAKQAKRTGEDQGDLEAFIPDFEIYRGSTEYNFVGTSYIWTPEPKLVTFDLICREVHEHPCEKPEHKLVLILKAIESLTRCIGILHSCGMIHRDIKPSNFGFIKRGRELLTQKLSMFDIDSVCSVYDALEVSIGTNGYMEPEAGLENISSQTDIYSIGATLFNAVIVTDEAKAGGYLYKQEYYGRLCDMVNESRLITASEANSHPGLRNIISRILEKCLCGSVK